MTDAGGTKHVGILALEVYTPRTFVQQTDLETHAGVAAGKYTIGLGQQGVAVTGDAEDVNSLALTAVHNLLEKYVRHDSVLLRRCQNLRGMLIPLYLYFYA